ncbi:xanthine/uracil/vitamin C permease-like protein [Haematococcus lacustris]
MASRLLGRPFDALNRAFAKTAAGQYFEVDRRKTTLTTEIRAGTVTFLTLAYILAVNAGILQETGGTCDVHDCQDNTGQPLCMFGMPGAGRDPGYLRCVEQVKRSLISATAISSMLACVLMGTLANMPLALAPGMGINAFFAFTVVGYFGYGGLITYRQAVAAVFVEGWIFLLISITGVRGHIVRFVPRTIMLATAGGIGLFLAFIGLQQAEGIGLITADTATLVTLGGCPFEDRIPLYAIGDVDSVCSCQMYNGTAVPTAGSPRLGPASASYYCGGKRMRSATTWLGICGGLLMVLLMGRDFRGAIMIGILFVTVVSWVPNHSATYLGASSQLPGGQDRFNYFKSVVSLPDVRKTTAAWDWSGLAHADLWAALLSFLYLDFLDCTGTLFSMATYLDRMLPGFINHRTSEFPRQTAAFCVDGIAIIIGSLLGTSPLTVFIESATGIREGGRTGLTALTVAAWFLVSLFFTPIIAAIPPYATGPALVLVGALMMENLLDIKWSDIQQAVPAFITITMIPLTYSVAYGVLGGVFIYVALYLGFLLYDLVLAALGWSELTVKNVLQDAVPEALQPNEDEEEEGFTSVKVDHTAHPA